MLPARTILASLAMLALMLGPARAVTPEQRRQIDQMRKTLSAEGPAKTLGRYFSLASDETHKEGPGYALVETGDADAVKVAVSVHGVSDGAVSESLDSSMAKGLANNPEAVLPYVAHPRVGPTQFHANRMCVPFLPADDPDARGKARAALDRAETALGRVRDPALAEAKAACLEVIADYREAIGPR